MIKRNITLEEAERRFPRSTVQWDIQGGPEYVERVNAELQSAGVHVHRWHILQDVLCISHRVEWGHPRPALLDEIAFWVVGDNALHTIWRFKTPSGLLMTSLKSFEGQWMFWGKPHRWRGERDIHDDFPGKELILGSRPPRASTA